MVRRKCTRWSGASGVGSGFTIIELLTVMAILSLLIAILLPTLHSARRASKETVCIANIKNIAGSSKVYEAADPNGWTIPVHRLQFQQDPSSPSFIGTYEWGGKAGVGDPGHVPGAAGNFYYLTSRYGTKAGFGPATRPLNDLLYPGGLKDNLNPQYNRQGATDDTTLKLDLFRCPADDAAPRAAHCRDWVDNPTRSSYDHFGTSFAANTFFIAHRGMMQSNSPYLRSVSRVPNAARTLYYEENIGRFAWACKKMPSDCSGLELDPGRTRTIVGWHGKDWTFNRAFVDGHADTQKVVIAGTEDDLGFVQHFAIESVYKDGDAQTAFGCFIVRGPNWQKDCLPQPFEPTGLKWTASTPPWYENCVSAKQ
ncbi:MAG: prepilin-type N-terminal cleavage/methylation domain-containing protein [Planctomycetes bacterium]|nr:prepilin-type N-terminal cleavage/methylation domain-containing protein [Planctomycetota bacterium]